MNSQGSSENVRPVGLPTMRASIVILAISILQNVVGPIIILVDLYRVYGWLMIVFFLMWYVSTQTLINQLRNLRKMIAIQQQQIDALVGILAPEKSAARRPSRTGRLNREDR